MTEHKDAMTPEYPAHEDCKTECWFSATMRAQAETINGLEELLLAATILTATGKGLSPEETFCLHTLLDVRENDPHVTTGNIAAALVEANAVRMTQAAELTALRAERDRDHANINLKADFIAATVVQLAQMEAERDALQQGQTYRHIGKDGKPILARDLEADRDAALAEIERLNAGWLEANTTALINALERDAALAPVGVLEVALTGARGDILSLLHGRGCEFEGSDEDWVGDIDTIISAKLATKGAAE